MVSAAEVTDLVANGHKAHGLGLAHHIAVGRKPSTRATTSTRQVSASSATRFSTCAKARAESTIALRPSHRSPAQTRRRSTFRRRERNDRQRLGHLDRAVGVVVEQRLTGLVGVCEVARATLASAKSRTVVSTGTAASSESAPKPTPSTGSGRYPRPPYGPR